MKKNSKLVLGIIIGIAITLVWFALKHKSSAKIYTVHSVGSHSYYSNANSQTDLVVFTKGETGHVLNIHCAFPPGFNLTDEDMDGGWKVKVSDEVYQVYAFGVTSYFCERVE